MGAGEVRPTYKLPPEGFTTPLDESRRWNTAVENHLLPERRQSGGLSDSPEDNPPRPNGPNPGKPFKF